MQASRSRLWWRSARRSQRIRSRFNREAKRTSARPQTLGLAAWAAAQAANARDGIEQWDQLGDIALVSPVTETASGVPPPRNDPRSHGVENRSCRGRRPRPDTGLGPVPQAAPSGHLRAPHHLNGDVLPGNAFRGACERCLSAQSGSAPAGVQDDGGAWQDGPAATRLRERGRSGGQRSGPGSGRG